MPDADHKGLFEKGAKTAEAADAVATRARDSAIDAARQSLAQCLELSRQERVAEALKAADEGLRVARAVLPPSDYIRGVLVVNGADLHMRLGHYLLAEQLVLDHLRALDSEPAGGDQQEIRNECTSVLENLYVRAGRHAEAEVVLVSTIKEHSRRTGSNAKALGARYYLLALVHAARGRWEGAEGAFQKFEEVRTQLPPGSEDRNSADAMLSELAKVLGKNAEPAEAHGSEVFPGNVRPEREELHRREVEAWRFFVDREFDLAASASLRVLVWRSSARLVYVRLCALLWLGLPIEKDVHKALAVAPAGSVVRGMIEFLAGRIPLKRVTSLAQNDADLCLVMYYSAVEALRQGHFAEARAAFRHAAHSRSTEPEQAQSLSELDSLDYLAQEIGDLDAVRQGMVRQGYRAFAVCDYGSVLKVALDGRPTTPELLLLACVALEALGSPDSRLFVGHARRMMVSFPWHTRLLGLLRGRVYPGALLSGEDDSLRICQVHFYASIHHWLAGQWDESEAHRAIAASGPDSCAERDMAAAADGDPEAVLKHLKGWLVLLHRQGRTAEVARLAGPMAAYGRRFASRFPEAVGDLLAAAAGALTAANRMREGLSLFEEVNALPCLSAKLRFNAALNLGQAFLQLGALPKAIEVVNRAGGLAVEVQPDALNSATLYNALGMLAFQMVDIPAALDWYDKATKVLDGADEEEPRLRAAILDNFGLCHLVQRRFEKASDRFEDARWLLEKAAEAERELGRDLTGTIIKNLANLTMSLARSGRLTDAQSRALELERLCEGRGASSRDEFRSAMVVLAEVRWKQGRAPEALRCLLRAAAIVDDEVGELMSLGSEQLRMTYGAVARIDLSFLMTMAGRPGSGALEEVFDVVLRRKALTGEVAVRQSAACQGNRYPLLAPVFRELSAVRDDLARELLAGTEPGPGLGAKLDRVRALEAELAKAVPELHLVSTLREVTARQVVNAIPRTWSIVEFVRAFELEVGAADPEKATEKYWAFVVPGGDLGRLALIDLGPAANVDPLVRKFRRAVSNDGRLRHLNFKSQPPEPRRQNALARQLCRRVFDPILEVLPRTGHVIIATVGELGRVPFEVLRDEAGTSLVDRYSFSYVGTARELIGHSSRPRAPAGQDVVFADPDYNAGLDREVVAAAPAFTRLDGTRREGEEVAAMLGVSPVTGGRATVTRVRALSSPRILHIATHGFFTSGSTSEPDALAVELRALEAGVRLRRPGADPLLNTGLALAGANALLIGQSPADSGRAAGLLTALQVLDLDLHRTELVVLSACDTGLGEIHATEGILGLCRAFLIAGARTVIASLWKVPDDQTRLLMVAMYKRLLRGIGRADSLRAAQIELRFKYPLLSHWGAFVCVGDPGPMGGSR